MNFKSIIYSNYALYLVFLFTLAPLGGLFILITAFVKALFESVVTLKNVLQSELLDLNTEIVVSYKEFKKKRERYYDSTKRD